MKFMGDGDPLLIIIGGLANDMTQLDGIIDGLSRSCQVVAFDNRGAGRTDKPDEPYSMEMMAEDAAGLVEALGVQPVDALGISMGGRVAIFLTLAHPGTRQEPDLGLHQCEDGLQEGVALVDEQRPNQNSGDPQDRHEVPSSPCYAHVRQRDASRNYDATGRLHEIHVPTLILHGEQDRIVPFPLAEEIHENIAGSKLVVVEGGHTFPFRKQKEFIDLLREFLRAQKP